MKLTTPPQYVAETHPSPQTSPSLNDTDRNLLPTGNRVRPISWSREFRRAIIIPSELLCSDRPRAPSISWIPHTMIDDPILTPIWAGREARVSNAVCLIARVLIKDRVRMLSPVAWIHGIIADKLQLCKAVVAVIRAGGAVDEEVLLRLGVDELLWPLIGRQAVVACAAERCLLPCVLWYRDDLAFGEGRGDGPGIRQLGDAQICWPAIVLAVPA